MLLNPPQSLINEYVGLMEKYSKDLLEKRNPAFGGLPACPFVKAEREKGTIEYRFCKFSKSGPSEDEIIVLKNFSKQEKMTTLLLVAPQCDLSVSESIEYGLKLCVACRAERMIAIAIHPDDPFHVSNCRTRTAPFVTMLCQAAHVIQTAKAKLETTSYYENWAQEHLDYNHKQISQFL